MSSSEFPQRVNDPHITSSYPDFSALKKVPWVDVALVASCLGCLTIGILTSAGVFNAIGTTNAGYLAQGMYGGSAIALTAEIFKGVLGHKANNNPVDNEAVAIFKRLARAFIDNCPQEAKETLNNHFNQILNDPEFQKDPSAYIAKWQMDNEAQMEDPLLATVSYFFEIAYGKKKERNDEDEIFKKCAEGFIGNYPEEEQTVLTNYFNHVLGDAEFRKDPVAYIKKWQLENLANLKEPLFAAINYFFEIAYGEALKELNDDEVDLYKTLAQMYVNESPYHNTLALGNYLINGVLESAEFKKDSQAYIKNWMQQNEIKIQDSSSLEAHAYRFLKDQLSE